MSEWICPLPWDTAFFGFKIGRINPRQLEPLTVSSNLAHAQRAGFQCLYFEAAPHDATTVELAERYGFHLVDVRVVLEQGLDLQSGRPSRSRVASPSVSTGPYRPEDIASLEEIAVEIGHLSRFQFDNNFPADAQRRLYRAWLHKSIADESGALIVAYENGVVAGLITCENTDGLGRIILIGVRSHFRGHGVAEALVQASLDWFRSQGSRRVQVITQVRNVPAQRLYQKMGFLTHSVTLMYHRWL